MPGHLDAIDITIGGLQSAWDLTVEIWGHFRADFWGQVEPGTDGQCPGDRRAGHWPSDQSAHTCRSRKEATRSRQTIAGGFGINFQVHLCWKKKGPRYQYDTSNLHDCRRLPRLHHSRNVALSPSRTLVDRQSPAMVRHRPVERSGPPLNDLMSGLFS
jgi:hypothetical protein